jgi:hypothetical protein
LLFRAEHCIVLRWITEVEGKDKKSVAPPPSGDHAGRVPNDLEMLGPLTKSKESKTAIGLENDSVR